MSVTAPRGFRASGVTAGLKKSGKSDVALVVNDGPLHVAAGVFTSNRVVAAPVLWSRQAIEDGRIDAVILNSGGANACTGPEGFGDAHATAEHTAAALRAAGMDVSSGDVAVCSTGLIGVRLDMGALLPGATAAVGALSISDGD
ncbi:MAG TPA: bifunctional ornithine acetyltransferase/N-acetylglutamate synthase, partial [Demequinaceae bacterium]